MNPPQRAPPFTHLRRIAAHPIQILVIWRHHPIVAPRIQNVLPVAVERQETAEIRRRTGHKLLLRQCFRLRERLSSGEYLRARLLRCTLTAPAIAKVAVQIDARTAAATDTAAILAPQSIGGVRVLVAIGVGHRQDVPVGVAHVFRLIVPVLDELIDDVRDGGGADPFACVNAAVHPDGGVRWVAV